jgi:retinoid hydroxylase
MVEIERLPPGSYGFPLIGESIDWLVNPNFFKDRAEIYGNIFKTSLFGDKTVVLIGHEANRFLFENEGKFFSDGMAMAVPKSTTELMGSDSLVLQMGTQHKKNRRIIYPTLQSKALEDYFEIINKQTLKYLKKWEKQHRLTWHEELKNYSLSIATEAFLGIDVVDSDKEFSHLYTIWGEGLLSFPIDLPFTKFGNALRCRKLLLDKINKIIESKKVNSSKNNLLDKLLEQCDNEESSLTRENLSEQLLTLLFAGHDTLSSALTSLCQFIAEKPNIRQKLYEEQLRFSEVKLSITEINKMEYLTKFVEEVLRFAPPTGGPPRKVLKDCNFKGYTIPKGWNILYNIGQTHKDIAVYACPHNFNPENKNKDKKNPAFSYIPFGAGSRECVGKDFAVLELKILAIHLIRDYEWEILHHQSLRKVLLPALHPKDGLRVKFFRKQTKNE